VGYAELLPAPRLRALVACTWAMSGPSAPHRVLPDGCIDVLVLGGIGARVVGTMTRALVAPLGHAAVVGIRFRPGEAARLLRVASRELTDLDAPLGTLWGDDGRSLEDELLVLLDDALREGIAAAAIVTRAHVRIERVLERRLASHGEAVDLRVRAAADLLADGESVRATATRIGLSERQLARRFSDRVGVSPKIFGRVLRLQRAALLLGEGRAPSSAAALAGYADQAHFTRDATELAGITPAGLARELSDSFKTTDDIAI
jgi:AraC-like DNA-binding protein